jgi:hypothetical protein
VGPARDDRVPASDVASYPTPDVTIERIGALVEWDVPALLAAATQRRNA